jgi:endo-1,4-beta-xylanase
MKGRRRRFVAALLALLLMIPGGFSVSSADGAAPDIPVLLYHIITDNPANEWNDISTEDFHKQMKYLNDNGYTTLSADEYVDIMEGKATAPDKPVLLTFDDATPDFVTEVLPVLEKYDMKAVLFVVPDWIDGTYSMSEAELAQVAQHPNVSIENHSYDHDQGKWQSNFDQMTQAEASQSIADANAYIKALTGRDPVLFAYPFGSYNDTVKAALAKNGIKYAFTVNASNGNDEYEMGRHYITYTRVTSLAQFAGMVGGPAPSAEDEENVVVFHETFAKGISIARQSGNADMAPVSGKVFDGNADGYALYVNNRTTNDYDAADFYYSDMGLKDGKTYTVTVSVYADDGVSIPANARYVLLTVDGYTWLSNVNMEAGKGITLTGTFTVDTATASRLRVQTDENGAGIPFYIGDILITAKKEAVEQDGYHETFIDGIGKASPAGSAKIDHVDNLVFDGNDDGAAIYIYDRTNNWDGADFAFSKMNMHEGKSYTITVVGYVDDNADVPAGAQVLLQNVDSYQGLYEAANMEKGKAFTLTGTYTVDSANDRAFRVQSNEAGKTVPFYIGEVKVVPDNSRPPALPFTLIDFEDNSPSGFEGRSGTEKLIVTDKANHTPGGSYALLVEERSDTWHGPSLRVEKYVDLGQEYHISAWVKLVSPSSAQLTLSTQVGSSSYININSKTVSVNDGWVLLEGTYRYTSAGDEFLTIYIESPNSADASFYIDDINFVNTGAAPIEVEKDLPPIKDIYENDFLIGNIMNMQDLEGPRLELLKQHFNVLTAENAMKPEYNYDENRNFDFTEEDELVAKAVAEGFKIVGHTLVWHSQSPPWLWQDENGQPLARDEALDNLRRHITTVVKHFGEKFGDNIIAWDVVNEAMSDNPANPTDWRASLRPSGWYQAIGDDYIKEAFLAAKEAIKELDLNTKLYYNDYNDDNKDKATAIYHMVKELNEEYAQANNGELLIDGIGMQSHYGFSTNPANVENSLRMFSSLGVEISVTELDIGDLDRDSRLTEQEAIQQGYLYAQLFDLYKKYKDHIARVTFWGLSDDTSWRSEGSPLLFDKNLKAKPAYYGVINPTAYLEDFPPEQSQAKHSFAQYGTPAIDGVEDAVWSNAPVLQINVPQQPTNVSEGIARVLWDEDNLYVLVHVYDDELDQASANPWEQDSVEVFVDENNAKTPSYEADDGQYRVRYDNDATFNPASAGTGFESKTRVDGTTYTVEMKIPFKTVAPQAGHQIGFDVQINDAKDGSRQGVNIWNDPSGVGYQDTSVFGVLTLIDGLMPPINAEAEVLGTSSVRITWDYEDAETVTFSVYRASSASGPFDLIAEGLTDTEFTDTGLQSATTYYYRLYTVSDSDVSLPFELSVRTKANPPAKPTGLTARVLDDTTIKLDWNDNAEPSVTYAVYRSRNASGPFEKLDTGFFRLRVSEYTDRGLDKDTTYYYQVYAVVDDQVSEPSAIVSATTGVTNQGGSSGSSSSGPAPPEVTVGEDGVVTIKPPVTTENGRAKAGLDSDTLQRALEQVTADDGGATIVLEIDAADAEAVDVELPKESLASEETYVISLKTPQGTIDMPSNMLEGIATDAETITISIAKVSADELDETVRAQIGDRPVISLNVIADGNVIAWNNPNAPVTVSIPYEPTSEELANPDHIVIWYIDDEGRVTAVPNGRYDAAAGAVVFRTTHFSTYAVAYVVKSFSDLASVPWAQKAVEAMASRDVIAGVGANRFNPSANITRADFIALLVRALELQDKGESVAMFDDVAETDYFYSEVKIAKQWGIASGTGNNRFESKSFITRQDMMVLAERALQAAGKTLPEGGALDRFADAGDVAGYARASAEKLVAAGIVSGMNGKLAPKDHLTRAQAAVILYQLWSK